MAAPSPFRIRIQAGTRTAIYRQIVDQICLLTATGALKVGDPLTSIRALAQELLINPNTVAKAYAELSREGILTSRQGQGFRVALRRPIYSRPERSRRLAAARDAFVAEALALGCSAKEILDTVEKSLREVAKSKDDQG